jgi:hypothetical protein
MIFLQNMFSRICKSNGNFVFLEKVVLSHYVMDHVTYTVAARADVFSDIFFK